jgi:hypothetical protein
MAESDDISVSIVGMCESTRAAVAVLLNIAEAPVDADSIASFVHQVSLSDGGFHGDAVYSSDEWLTSIASDRSGSMFASSMEGSIHVFDGTAWSIVPAATGVGMNCVHAVGTNIALAGGLDGSIFQVTGTRATLVAGPTGSRLNSIDGCASDCIYAVGDDGQIVRFDGRQWLPEDALTNANLLSVLCLSPDNVYVAGADGMMFRWNGVTWSAVAAPSITISSLAPYGGKIFAAGGKAGIFSTDGGPLKQVKPVALYRVEASNGLLFGAASRFFAWHDGNSWQGGQYDPT